MHGWFCVQASALHGGWPVPGAGFNEAQVAAGALVSKKNAIAPQTPALKGKAHRRCYVSTCDKLDTEGRYGCAVEASMGELTKA